MSRPAATDRLAAMLLTKENRATEVARLLHDNVGQTLTAVGFHLHSLKIQDGNIVQIQSYLEDVLANVREACNQLQSNVIERSGLPIAIDLLADKLREDKGLQLKKLVRVDNKCALEKAFAVYRVAELALDNVIQHSGVNHAELVLTSDNAGIHARIVDRGRGFDAKSARTHPPGTGLVLMEAYARSAGLQLHVDSTASQGTIVQIQTF